MAYLGLQPNTPLLNTSTETFSGNSILYQFTLARSVASASDLDVMIGSTLQRPNSDYEAGGTVLLFYSPPATGTNNITVTYRAGALNSLDLTVNTFNAGTVADPGIVSLAANNTGIYWANASSMSVTVSGTNRATFNANAISSNVNSGALTVAGGIGATGNINTSGRINITDTTQSGNVNSGSFTTTGGAGIVGNLNVGGDITCVGDFTVNGTFTTTGTDSLAVTDPFIFLAVNNPGDTYDSGVVSQYNDGANTRYTGYFRDITDAKYKLFTNLLTQPTTTVDTTDPSFQYTDLILANLSATGNVTGTYFIGNGSQLTGIASGSTSNIFNANTTVAIAAVNANVNMVVNSVQIANVWSGGISVVGAVTASTTVSATGNVIAGNVSTAGVITSTGNVTSAANVSAGNLTTGGAVVASGNVTGGNIIGTTNISTTGSVVGGTLRTAGIVSAAGDVYGNNFSATTDITAGGNIGATGDLSGANLTLTGFISTPGNITGSYFLGNGSALTGIDATSIQFGNSNVRVISSGGNVAIGIGGTANIAVFSTLGANVTGWIGATGNLGVGGNVAFTGTTQNITIGTSQTTGNVTVGGATQTGFIQIGQSTNPQTIAIGNGVTGTGNTKTIGVGENGAAGSTTLINFGPVTATTAAGTVTFNTATIVAIANTSGTALSVAGNVTGANIRTGGSATATGNIVGGNIATAGLITATGNITGGNIITGGAVSITGASTAASYSATGNVTGGNVLTGGLMSSTGNATHGNIDTAGLITATGNIVATANVRGGNMIATTLVQGSVLSATANIFATANVSGAYFLGTGISLSGNVISGISTTANITGSNIIATAAMSAASVSASGQVTGSQFNGSGAGLTSIPGANVTGTVPNANATVNVTGVTALLGYSTSAITVGNVNPAGPQVTAQGAGAAVMAFHRPGSYGVNMGLDTDNVFKIGGWSAGLNTYFFQVSSAGAITASTFSGVSTTAKYADLAEYYAADTDYPPGTVLSFGGDREVTMTTGINDVRVAGVVSTNPAYAMNTAIEAEHTVALALTGRVPTLVIGAVAKGDMMVSAGGGRAKACATPVMGSVIGKAVQDHPGGQGTIEIVVGRL